MKDAPEFEADLHCHTSASDGELSPEEVVELACRTGLKALAITDHDTIGSLKSAARKAAQLGLILVKGIEINADGKEKEVHMLGLGLDENNGFLNKKLAEIRENRLERAREILAKLSKLGIDIDWGEVVGMARGGSVGRPHIAQAVMNHGFAGSFREAFDKYLKIGSPAYVPRKKLTPAAAIQIIRQAGGVAVLAHPGSKISETEIKQWMNEGLQGIEVSHPDHSLRDTEKYKVLAKNLRLIATGGSDFHGPRIRPEVKLGQWGTDLEAVARIERAKSR
jgi:predicted metal-dependent phosphoesterase TrpH